VKVFIEWIAEIYRRQSSLQIAADDLVSGHTVHADHPDHTSHVTS
jgi:LysR family transcriptional regulator, regulator for bpeEF and oprC